MWSRPDEGGRPSICASGHPGEAVLTLTSPVATPWHRVGAAPKLAALAVATVVLFALDDPGTLALTLAGIAALHAPGGAVFARHAVRMLRPLWPFVLVLAILHLWTGAWREGAVIVLRLVAAVAAANLVTMTTPLGAMMTVAENLARPLARLGLPPRRLALALALAIRFMPVQAIRIAALREAWAARSQHRPGWRILVPATLAALDDAERVAEALRARGGAG